MKILQVIPSYFPAHSYGGPITSTHELCKNLVKKGIHTKVLTTNSCGKTKLDVETNKDLKAENVDVIYCPSKTSYYLSISFVKEILRHIKSYDIIHIHSIFTYTTFAAALAAQVHKRPYIVDPFGALNKDMIKFKGGIKKTIYLKLIDRQILNKAEFIHVASEFEKEKAAGLGFDPGKIAVINRGIDTKAYSQYGEEIYEAFPILRDKKIILFLGRIHPIKGLDLLISSYAETVKKYGETILVIAGPIEDEKYYGRLKTLAEEKNLTKKILFTGMVTGKIKASLLNKIYMFILPSISESFGVSILEAMACKKPVILTKNIGLAEQVIRAKAGIISDKSKEELVKAMDCLLSDETKAKEMGLKGYETADREFSWDKITNDMIRLYEKIL